MKEIEIQNRIRVGLSNANVTTFRNNTGVLKDANGRPVKFGLCNGSSDLICVTPIEITPDMVGRVVGVFTAIEVKQPGKNPTDAQKKFINHIKSKGGIGGVARSDDDAIEIINKYISNT